MQCQGKCQEACGPIVVAVNEAARMVQAGGPFVYHQDQEKCGYLGADGRCQVYDVRPLVCRLWGQTVQYPCQWGCQPKRVIGKPEATMLFQTLIRLSSGRWTAPELVGEPLTSKPGDGGADATEGQSDRGTEEG